MIVKPSSENIERAAEIIRSGGLVAFPTETVYGLGANALDPKAVEKIYTAKGRPHLNPLIVHLPDFDSIAQAADISDNLRIRDQLEDLRYLMPGPLSIVLPKKNTIPDLVSAGLPSIAVRIPAHPAALEFLEEAGVPIAAPSANISSSVSPTCAEHVAENLGDKVNLIIDGGSCKIGLESTVLSLLEEVPRVLRPGAITLEQLRNILGDVELRQQIAPNEAKPSPGMLDRHYAPGTKVVLDQFFNTSKSFGRVGLICFSSEHSLEKETDFAEIERLSQNGELSQVAATLYAAIRKQDRLDLDLIVVESCPLEGLGLAIMDRLKRATSPE